MWISSLVLKKDIMAALFLLIGAGLCCYISYSQILAWHSSITLKTDDIKTGAFAYNLLSGSDCFGHVSTKLTDGADSLAFELKGQLRARTGEGDRNFEFKSTANFNPLGQMNSAILIVKESDFEAGLGMIEVSPIRVSFWIKKAGESSRRELRIPGPLELKRTGIGAYRLTYQPLSKLQGSTAHFRLLENLRRTWKIEPRPPESPGCEGSTGRYDLSHLEQAGPVLQSFIDYLANTRTFQSLPNKNEER